MFQICHKLLICQRWLCNVNECLKDQSRLDLLKNRFGTGELCSFDIEFKPIIKISQRHSSDLAKTISFKKINLNNWDEVEHYLDQLDQIILECRLKGFGSSKGGGNDDDDNDGADGVVDKSKLLVEKVKLKTTRSGSNYGYEFVNSIE